jgi:hypothetical protein
MMIFFTILLLMVSLKSLFFGLIKKADVEFIKEANEKVKNDELTPPELYEYNKKTIMIGLKLCAIVIPLFITKFVYIILAFSFDPFLYPTIIITIISCLTLIVDGKKLTGKSLNVFSKTFNLIDASYLIFMFYVLVVL